MDKQGKTSIENNILILLDEVINMKGSTTSFIEEKSGKKLFVTVLLQKDSICDNLKILVREILLYIVKPELSLFLCYSSITKDNLTKDEVKRLIAGEEPIGKIFNLVENNTLIKKNIDVHRVESKKWKEKLKTRSILFYIKEYELYSKDRYIGKIEEVFNEETLSRILFRN